MANQQGRYLGETVIGTIAEDVGLGQVVCCTPIFEGGAPPDLLEKGVWRVASADLGDLGNQYDPYMDATGTGINRQFDADFWSDGRSYYSTSECQLGIACEAASYSPISLTQSGTQITILLKGYYSPGYIYGAEKGYCDGELKEGHAVYLKPKTGAGGEIGSAGGCISGVPPVPGTFYTMGLSYSATLDRYLPAIPVGGQPASSCATQSVVRVVGYCYDIAYPYIIRFEPDKLWVECRL